jgi:hypothetical protein
MDVVLKSNSLSLFGQSMEKPSKQSENSAKQGNSAENDSTQSE